MRFVSQSVSNPDLCPNLHQIMSPKRPRSEDAEDLPGTDPEMLPLEPDAEDSPGTDPEMLPLEPVVWVRKQEVRMSWTPPAPTQAEVEVLGSLTMGGLFDQAEHHPRVIKTLDRYMHSRH